MYKIIERSLLLVAFLNLVAVLLSFFQLDNVFSISSSSTNSNISYYIVTSFVITNFYTGSWLITSLCLNFLSRLFLRIEKNIYKLLNLICSVVFSISVHTLFKINVNELLIFKLSELQIDNYLVGSIIFFSTIFFIALGNQVKFIKDGKRVLNFLLLIFTKSKIFITNVFKFFTRFYRDFRGRILNHTKLIKNKPSKVSTDSKEFSSHQETLLPGYEKKVFDKDPLSTDMLVEEQDELIVDSSGDQVRVVEKTKSINKVKKKKDEFFKTKDLIDCIKVTSASYHSNGPDREYFKTIEEAIENKLEEFKVTAKVINILKGPVVDTFELELGAGVKVSKVSGLSDDLGLALNGAPLRVVYPMPGRSTIGIEVPRSPRELIYLDEVLHSKNFNNSKFRLPIAMGKDAFGEVRIEDLASMPHMLVAGSTGAGKSVFINTLLVSLIIKLSPEKLKLILIDPKQLELALYQDLPHLAMPVITDAKTSSIALLWCVQEMERRYSLLKEIGVKNIEGFNKKISTIENKDIIKLSKHYPDGDIGSELPYLVIIIDEFADLKLTKSGQEIEDNVNRLAAKARAAGIHIVLATQRPSTDVVTGVIKNNFPTRVAFRVTTATDSRVILDAMGAEKLLGKGDMLYKHGVDLKRIHSSFVEEDEVEVLVDKLSTIKQDFNTEAIEFMDTYEEGEVTSGLGPSQGHGASSQKDPLYDDAVKVVVEQNAASASMIQRRLKVGYNRAANLIEQMEQNGIVGPAQGAKPREVFPHSTL